MQAAMTGHLVLSTLHTNDAPSTLWRLKEMGIPAYLISCTVVGVLAQRLVRLLCTACRQAYRVPARVLRMLPGAGQAAETVTLYRPAGCSRCSGSGYRGRQGVFELLVMSEEIRQTLRADGNLQDLRRVLEAADFRNLRREGLELVAQGRTTVEEVFRISAD